MCSDGTIFSRFMWFSFTSVGAVTTCIIIMSLWEKFQTNPTITGNFIILKFCFISSNETCIRDKCF